METRASGMKEADAFVMMLLLSRVYLVDDGLFRDSQRSGEQKQTVGMWNQAGLF